MVIGSTNIERGIIRSEYRSSLDRNSLYNFGILQHMLSQDRFRIEITTRWTGDENNPEVMAMAGSKVSYAEALQRLLEHWSPAGAGPLQIGGG